MLNEVTSQSVLAYCSPPGLKVSLEVGYRRDGRHANFFQEPSSVLMILQKGVIQTSVSIRNNQSRGTVAWMLSMSRVSGFLNKVLALTHPELYSAAAKGLEVLREQGGVKNLSIHWISVFTGINVISNRRTIKHRDRFGHLPWYDLLISVGTYSRAKLVLDDLGAKFVYNSGTAVLLCGKLLYHEVPFWGHGDRVCWAHFMREAVLNGLGVLDRKVGWVTRDLIRSTIGI